MKSSVSSRFNADLLDQKYEQWCQDPQSVESDWCAFFEGFELGTAQLKQAADGPAPAAVPAAVPGDLPAEPTQNVEIQSMDEHYLNFRGKVVSLVYNYRTLGHTQAHLNPLDESGVQNPRLEISQFGLDESDLDRTVSTQFFRKGQVMTLRDMISALEQTYSGYSGFEFMHIFNTEVRNWIRDRVEHRHEQPGKQECKQAHVLRWLLESQLFESFIAKKFLGEKRFSLEGGEGIMVLLNTILEKCPASDVREIEMGMSHRGRLNVLRNFLQKSLTTLLYEFTPNYVPDLVAGDGDVKYHLGYEGIRQLPDGDVRVALAANPSHLEAVNAVVEGRARARQRLVDGDVMECRRDVTEDHRKKVLPILLHGDAAFAGQGSVAEVLNLSQLPGYRTGGTIHIIINNQIGFTTMPEDARSSHYATDVAKMIEAPVIHVNGEQPSELAWAAALALEFRQTFARDIVIDMYCYRRRGHNEADQAAFTQPHIYKKVDVRKPIGHLFKEQIVAEGLIAQAEADEIENEVMAQLDEGYDKMVEHMEAGDRTVFSGSTAEVQPAYSHAPVPTGISRDTLQHIGKVLTTLPEGFNLHQTLAKRFIPRRQEALKSGHSFDWAFAESLAWGSLLMEGHPVRLSGQDVKRGTFSQRHAVFYDSEERDLQYVPLKELAEDQAKFCVYNSLLSEAAVLGFDYGYSLSSPNMLIMWEAQFGDFANGAQVIIDQFISSAESKWQTPSSLVMLLPHGYAGMGPEHSSARLERFLQLCAEKNIQVANLTTPAQYFHALRRQKKRGFRKPLILMTPKSLLSRPEAVSTEEDFLEGACFQEILPDIKDFENPNSVERVIFCCGKVFYDLAQYRAEKEISNTAIIRIEQLYPFNVEMLELIISQYPEVKTWVWAQEEPRNMGARSYITPRLEAVLQTRIRYSGRKASSSPAAGSKAQHVREQKMLIEQAFEV